MLNILSMYFWPKNGLSLRGRPWSCSWVQSKQGTGSTFHFTTRLGRQAHPSQVAKLDGASAMMFFRKILLPLSVTNIAALVVIEFVYGWNQYLWPLLITTDPDMTTAVIGLQHHLLPLSRPRDHLDPHLLLQQQVRGQGLLQARHLHGELALAAAHVARSRRLQRAGHGAARDVLGEALETSVS